MDLYEAIQARHSVRSYLDKPIEEAKLRRVLDAGRVAPSARNRQEWKFVVVKDPELKSTLARKVAEQPFMAGAAVIVAIVGTKPDDVMYCDVPTDPVDCAIAIDHMTLAAVAEGLGTCWIGHFDQDACKDLLGVPDDCKVIELLPIGYGAEQDGAETKNRKPLDEVVCTDRFS